MNGFIISTLADLKATETIDLIREAFQADCVDLSVLGDVEDLEIAMGLRAVRETPPPKLSLIPGLEPFHSENGGKEELRDFHTGTFTNPYKQVGRNDPCPCGSGKKFKKCCLH